MLERTGSEIRARRVAGEYSSPEIGIVAIDAAANSLELDVSISGAASGMAFRAVFRVVFRVALNNRHPNGLSPA